MLMMLILSPEREDLDQATPILLIAATWDVGVYIKTTYICMYVDLPC